MRMPSNDMDAAVLKVRSVGPRRTLLRLITLVAGGSALLFHPLAVNAQQLADPVDHRVIAVPEQDFCETAPWHLVFSDDFDGDTLNTDRWLRYYPYCYNGDECLESRKHGGASDLVIFQDKNVQMTGQGTVKLIARRSDTLTHWYSAASRYTSGMLHSRMQFTRGRFEIRCKVPLSTSHWLHPAFWLFGGGPVCSEIDILEILWDRSTTCHSGSHRYNSNCDGIHASDETTNDIWELANDFHVFRVDWDKWYMSFYVDDVLMYKSCRIYDLLNRPVSKCHVAEGIYIQNQAFPAQDADMSIIVNLSVHNAAMNDAIVPGPMVPNIPCALEVDYVRVYQR